MKPAANAATGTNTIEVGESLVFTFDVNTAGSLPPNATVTNRAVVSGDSLASTNLWDVQRFTGDTNHATFISSDFSPSKILFSTSETGPADSTGANLQIGEIATYEISVGLPEGTITDLQITDFMPTGMAYVVGSLVVITNDLAGTLAPVTNISPNAGVLGASGQNVVVVWEGDSVLSATTNTSSQILHLRLDAVVMDVPAERVLAHAHHYAGATKFFAFDGFAPAIRQSVDPKWPNVTPYIVLLSRGGAVQRGIGPPEPAMLRNWLA